VEIGFGVNYVAVVVAAVAAVLIGILYYGVAGFGDRLARLNGTAPRTVLHRRRSSRSGSWSLC